MKQNPYLLTTIAMAAMLSSGCTIGKKSILFATKTSLGVDIDSKPPTLDIGFSRKEGTVSPEYEDGQALPQMASFSTGVSWFKVDASQSFAVGDAAIILSKYLGTDAKPIPTNVIEDSYITNNVSRVTGGNARRYLFFTDTSFALKVNWGVETATPYPDALHLGYKRKELAFVPIQDKVVKSGTVTKTNHFVPSLIATADLGTDVSTPSSSRLRYKQFYATGLAADYLAAQPAVRDALGVKIINDAEVQAKIAQAAKANAERANFGAQEASFEAIRQRYKSPNATNAQKKEIRAKAAELELLLPTQKDDDPNFTKNLSRSVNRQKPENGDKFTRLKLFVESLKIE